MFGNFLSGRYAGRVGLNRMMLIGGVVATAGMALALALFARGPRDARSSFFGSILFVGVGNGLLLPSANAGLVSVRPHLAGSASGPRRRADDRRRRGALGGRRARCSGPAPAPGRCSG